MAEDADRLARFRREAQVLASLNHPHVAAIYPEQPVTHLELVLNWFSELKPLASGGAK